ncbi:MAG: hypothetical protein CMM78_03815 [Rhodospirillaceae bacterium]|jgi:hypothetical protein|uniref:hypothetical protein n=1 Tax=Hwanghaeella sp. 1Z406 TaxID=3402811 RepID=UPI000C47BD1A|nr:hypothetical protein [Rhodospirillales bacterium]MAX47313.1 hypothetical protein [Rhodospirillaceae bacterium]|tara:strand:+ start:2701 stop:3201 length:501 start_codon:yes stop_codon:yes gene_type:complete
MGKNMFKKILIGMVCLMLFSSSGSASGKFLLNDYSLAVEELSSDGIYKTYSFSYNGSSIGEITSIDLSVRKIQRDKKDNFYFVFAATTGGSGCSEVILVISVTDGQYNLSPSIYFCGGLENAEYIENLDGLYLDGADRSDQKIHYYVNNIGKVKASETEFVENPFF